MNIFKVLLHLIILSNLVSFSYAGTWADRRAALEKVTTVEKFRIFYSLKGKDSLPINRRIDTNGNGIPDFIEDVRDRLKKADRFFQIEVGLISPLKNKRYRGKAHYIDVHILDFSLNKKGPRNGVAYDGAPWFSRNLSKQSSRKVLVIDLSGLVRLDSNTVEHELFHLYQNGYTYFKNRWYTEGTARWSELAMNNRLGRGGPLPDSSEKKQQIFAKTYDANRFWNEIMIRADKRAKGKKFIKRLLEQLDYMDDIAAKERGIPPMNWKESEQRSNLNNSYIWRAAIESIEAMNASFNQDNELKKLKEI